jgi:hypothetical protein
MKLIFDWFRTHSSAILGTAIAVSKAGLLGKAGSTLLAALAALCGSAV